ncbi:uncharacterized protein LOC135218628 isoform X2 [Macrobrachium nipponense]|uniref:uncharacterized protein LOC135218628 isoform X2 n=1 Tax=Macrobrachium nipponense TaxID=159736 RepID=UPI0030C7A807
MDEEEALECPVCFESYDNAGKTPKMMPCLHTICVSCILDLISGNARNTTAEYQTKDSKEPVIPSGKTLMCPLCRESIGSNRIQTNRYILAHLRDKHRLQSHSISVNADESNSVQRVAGVAVPSSSSTLQLRVQPTIIINESRGPIFKKVKEKRHLKKDRKTATPRIIIKRKAGVEGNIPCGTFSRPTQNIPTTPVAGPPLIYPKLPPATTLHQRSPSEQRAVMKIIGMNTPTISEGDFINTNDSPYHFQPESNSEYTSQLTPSAPEDMSEMWCRTCDEPGKSDCTYHDLIPILKDEEVNWIQTQLRGGETEIDQERNIALSAAMSKVTLGSNALSEDVARISEHHRKTPSQVPNMSRWSYAEIRDTVNTSCQPEECYRELDRRRSEYQRTIGKKKALHMFLKLHS